MGHPKWSKLWIILAAGWLSLFPSLNSGKSFFSFFSIETIFKRTVCSILNFAGLDVSSAEKLAWFSGRLWCDQSETNQGNKVLLKAWGNECRISPRIWRFEALEALEAPTFSRIFFAPLDIRPGTPWLPQGRSDASPERPMHLSEDLAFLAVSDFSRIFDRIFAMARYLTLFSLRVLFMIVWNLSCFWPPVMRCCLSSPYIWLYMYI